MAKRKKRIYGTVSTQEVAGIKYTSMAFGPVSTGEAELLVYAKKTKNGLKVWIEKP